MLSVLISVDTEIWPSSWEAARRSELREDFLRDIHGRTPRGDFGLPFQLRVLQEHGLKASFFVESLSPLVVGDGLLGEIVGMISAAGQEVELHLHPEWLQAASPFPVEYQGPFLGDYPREQQELLIREARDRLAPLVSGPVQGFRAGNYGADGRTLQALAGLGFTADTSFNRSYLDRGCQLDLAGDLDQPAPLEGLLEVPISNFEDWGGHHRYAGFCNCSHAELTGALALAEQAGWGVFVLVTHSFELLNISRTRPDPLVIRRFERFCRFLGDHAQRFPTRHFRELSARPWPARGPARPLRSPLWKTGLRLGEQLLRRLL